jgi:uncharacterized protein
VKIADAMIAKFHDRIGDGFFDTAAGADGAAPLGALTARRKPLQDSPTPAANPAAAIAMTRLYWYTNHPTYKDAAEETLETFAGIVDHFGIYAGNYGVALRMFTTPHTQVVVHGNDALADELEYTARREFALTKSVVRYRDGQAVAPNLPPALAETIPQLPAIEESKSVAVICSAFACQPPIFDPAALSEQLKTHLSS